MQHEVANKVEMTIILGNNIVINEVVNCNSLMNNLPRACSNKAQSILVPTDDRMSENDA